MGKWRLSLFGLCCFFLLSGQSERDSLILESLKNTRNPEVLQPLAEAMMRYDDSEMKARGNFVQGLAYNYGAEPSKAAQFFFQALQHLDPVEDYDQRFTYSMVLKNLGIAYYRSQQMNRGDSAFNQLKERALAKDDSLSYALALKSISGAMVYRERYDTAVALMRDAIAIYEDLDYRGIPLAYMSMGSVFGRMGQAAEAQLWFRKALARLGPRPDRRLEGRIYNNLAVSYRQMQQWDSAQYFLQEALQIQEQLGSVLDQIEIRANLARNAIEQEQYQQAETYLSQAEAQLMDKDLSTSATARNLSLLRFDLSFLQQDKEKADQAMQGIIQGMGYAKIEADWQLMKRLSQYYELRNEKDSALYYLKASENLKEKLAKEKDAEKIKKAANEVELMNLKNQQSELRSQNTRLVWFGLALFVILASILAYNWWRRKSQRTFTTLTHEDPQASFQFQDRSNIQEPSPRSPATDGGPAQLKLKSKAVVNVRDIIYAQSEGHYVNVFLKDKSNPEVDRTSLKSLQEDLSAYNFQRIHRSYLLNCDCLKAVYATKVLLNDGTELPVSRTYKDELQARFNEKSGS